MEDRLANLPGSWMWTWLGDTTGFKNGINFNKDQKGDKGILTVDVLNMYSKGVFLNLDRLYRVNKPVDDEYLLRYGDVLFVRSSVKREGVGWASAFKEIPEPVTFCGFIIRARFQEQGILPEYATYFLRTNFARELIVGKGSQVTITNISQDSLGRIPFPLAPFPEQHRIVAKIEELFTRLDAGVEALKKIKTQLKRYRQAVLKYAFEGKLTNENMVEGQLPDGWKLFPIGKVVKTIDGDRGSNYPKKNEFFEKGHCLFLSTKNVRKDKFVFEENIFISKEKDEILRGGKLQLNDVVITTRGTLGNVALYDDRVPFKNVRINSGMLILRVINPMLNNYYLMKFVSSPLFIKQLKEKQSGTAQPQIPANVLREIQLPIPPTLEEQENIFAEIESHLSVCDKIEESIENSLKQSEALRQSILKQAFEGKLVPQDPTDEPADKLLDRIKEEKAKREAQNNKTKKHRSKNSKQMELI